MRFTRPDYRGRIIDLAGKIPDNEPAFLLLARDRVAIKALKAYVEGLHLNSVPSSVIIHGNAAIAAFHAWQKVNMTKLPDISDDEYKGNIPADAIGALAQSREHNRELVQQMDNDLLLIKELEAENARLRGVVDGLNRSVNKLNDCVKLRDEYLVQLEQQNMDQRREHQSLKEQNIEQAKEIETLKENLSTFTKSS